MHTKNLLLTLCGIVVCCAVAFLKFHETRLQRVIQGLQLAIMEFRISKTWNGSEIDHAPIVISLSAADGKGLQVNVKAPFFNSPPAPNSAAGQPCDRLWDYEGNDTILSYSISYRTFLVVEVFFLNDKGEYIEVELCP